uniref:Uncharacterized protein n=1 Tax=Setaria digitata TaxID=48799 RepID=A0A915PXG1_9BILA
MAFKIGDELITMIGEFANMNRSPDFKVKTSENSQKVPKMRLGRQHSLNLAVGVSDEKPPFSEVNIPTRRQSTGKISETDGHIGGKRTLSAPPQMKTDIDQIRKRREKSRKMFTLKDKPTGTEGLEAVTEEETDLMSPSIINMRTENVHYQQASNNCDNDNGDDIAVKTALLPSTSTSYTKIINNMDHRGSIVLIDDNDDTKCLQSP